MLARGLLWLLPPIIFSAGNAAWAGDAVASISIALGDRMNQQAEVPYTALQQGGTVSIYPSYDDFNHAWNGDGTMQPRQTRQKTDWGKDAVYLDVTVKAADQSPVTIRKLELRVDESDPYLKPLLSVDQHFGCVGFRPSFSFVNHGWGPVTKAKLTLQFANDGAPPVLSAAHSGPLNDFADGNDVMLETVLGQEGVNVAALKTERFSCPSEAELQSCRNNVVTSGVFGKLAQMVWGDSTLFTSALGTIDYSWSDADGTAHQASEAFSVPISLAAIEVSRGANLGAGDMFTPAPEVIPYRDVKLKLRGKNYGIALPVKGARQTDSYTASVKLHADKASFHVLRAVATLADGSTAESPPINLYFYRERPTRFTSSIQTGQCYLRDSDD